MTTTTDTYLGVIDGLHRWDDGSALPLLRGFDDEPEDEPEDDATDDADADDDTDDDEPIEDASKIKDPTRARSARQAASYRVQRNRARQQRDAVRLELAFVKAAGGQFVDADSAWKLADQSLLSFDDKGNVIGAEEAVEALCESQPFLLVPDDEAPAKREPNPFTTAKTSGRPMNGKKRTEASSYDLAQLESKYPALRGRRR